MTAPAYLRAEVMAKIGIVLVGLGYGRHNELREFVFQPLNNLAKATQRTPQRALSLALQAMKREGIVQCNGGIWSLK
jgi:hypothetical protein